MSYYKDADEIQNELLEQVDDKYSKEKGHWLWEILKAVSCGISDLTEQEEEIANKLYIDNLTGEDLDNYIENWSYITRKTMTQASGYVTFTAKSTKTGTIESGTVVGNGRMNYITTEDAEITDKGGSVTVPVVAENYGAEGNSTVGTITKLITSVDFLLSVYNYTAITGGEDEESDDEVRERYKEAMKKVANAGNVAFYEEKAKAVEGVGRAYCIPCPNDVAGTVDLYVTNSEGQQVTSEVLKNVQDYIDPNQNGDGAGEAPIGAICTVKNPELQTVEVESWVTLAEGCTIEDVESTIRSTINTYLQTAFDEKILRYQRIGKCIIEAEGVKDFRDLEVNGEITNIEIKGVKIFTLGKLLLKEDD